MTTPPRYGIQLADRGHGRRLPGANLHAYLAASANDGQHLDAGTRASFENSLGVDLASVRVNTDERAAAAADSLGARAFTLGSTIWFGRDEYRPATHGGRRLLAHEVAHTVQQRHAPATIQPELVIGHANDPAEAAADRAAEAMLRGQPTSLGSDRAVLRRECRAENPPIPMDRSDQRLVTCTPSNEQWIAREVSPALAARRPVTRARASFDIDQRRVEGAVTICRGGTEVIVRLDANLTEAGIAAVGNALSGQSLGRGISIDPRLAIVITRSGAFQIILDGGPSVSVDTGNVTRGVGNITVRTPQIDRITLGVDYSTGQPSVRGAPPTAPQLVIPLTISLGAPANGIPHVDCSELPERPPAYECRRFTPATPGRPSLPGLRRETTTRIHAFFDHDQADVLGWRIGDNEYNGRTPPAAANEIIGLLLQGYTPQVSWGYASPEGEERRDRPTARSHFAGNLPLSDRRAIAARDALRALCLVCPRFETAAGLSERYGTDDRGRELPRGAALERRAIEGFTTRDELRPRDLETFLRQPHPAQLQQTFRMLRRATIVFERSPWVVEPSTGTSGSPYQLGRPETCSSDVARVARESLHLPTPRRR